MNATLPWSLVSRADVDARHERALSGQTLYGDDFSVPEIGCGKGTTLATDSWLGATFFFLRTSARLTCSFRPATYRLA
jgi:hypothetical protein